MYFRLTAVTLSCNIHMCMKYKQSQINQNCVSGFFSGRVQLEARPAHRLFSQDSRIISQVLETNCVTLPARYVITTYLYIYFLELIIRHATIRRCLFRATHTIKHFE